MKKGDDIGDLKHNWREKNADKVNKRGVPDEKHSEKNSRGEKKVYPSLPSSLPRQSKQFKDLFAFSPALPSASTA